MKGVISSEKENSKTIETTQAENSQSPRQKNNARTSRANTQSRQYHSDSSTDKAAKSFQKAIPRVSPPDNNSKTIKDINRNKHTHPPSPNESKDKSSNSKPKPPYKNLSHVRQLRS